MEQIYLVIIAIVIAPWPSSIARRLAVDIARLFFILSWRPARAGRSIAAYAGLG